MKIKLLPTPFAEPEIVTISTKKKEFGRGPSDKRMYTVTPKGEKDPYEYPNMPPYDDNKYSNKFSINDAVNIEPTDPRFYALNIYAVTRFALDMWEKYFGRKVNWWFDEYYERLELVALTHFANAHCGYGFIETGYSSYDGLPFALNHDVIAHELGHLIAYQELGPPNEPQQPLIYYFGFHEAISDLTALLSLLHFDSQLDELLNKTRGNLFTLNPASRIGKLTANTKQIRIAPNSINLEMVKTAKNPNVFEMPLLGFFYDLLAVIFQYSLYQQGLIDSRLARQAEILTDATNETIQEGFDRAYTNHHQAFKCELIRSRDILGKWLAYIMIKLSADDLHYDKVTTACLLADSNLTNNVYGARIEELAEWRKMAMIVN